MIEHFHKVEIFLGDIEQRFSDNDDYSDMDLQKLKPLDEIGIELPQEHDMLTDEAFVEAKNKDQRNVTGGEKLYILSLLYEYRSAFPKVYELYAPSHHAYQCRMNKCAIWQKRLSNV